MQAEFKPTATEEATKIANLPIISPGYRGSAVGLLQKILIANCYLESTSLNGIFDNNTLVAVKEYQRDHHLTVDGFVGSQTWYQLVKDISAPCAEISS